jgi:hypothetical protein
MHTLHKRALPAAKLYHTSSWWLLEGVWRSCNLRRTSYRIFIDTIHTSTEDERYTGTRCNRTLIFIIFEKRTSYVAHVNVTSGFANIFLFIFVVVCCNQWTATCKSLCYEAAPRP